MTWTDFKIDRSAFRVRPGLMIFSIELFTVSLLGLTPIPMFLGKGHTVVRILVLLAATTVLFIGCFSLNKDAESYRTLQMWTTLVAIISIAVSIPAFVLFTAIPVEMLSSSRFWYAASWELIQLGRPLAAVGWLGSFFGRGRSRLLLVIGSTMIGVLWGVA
jgi:hypothetical protein